MAPSCAAGADQRVQLVDEQDGVLGAAHLVHDGLDALLELAAVLGAGHHHGQVEHDDAAVAQQVGHVAFDDLLGEALDDGGLADAGFAEEHGVVLGAAAEDLDDAVDFVGPADDRVELALAGEFREVAPKLSRAGVLLLPLLACRSPRTAAAFFGRHIVPQKIQDFLTHVFQLETEVHQDLGGHALLFPEQPQEQVFGADVVVVEVPGLFDGVFDDFLGPRRLGQLAHRHHVRAGLHDLFDLQTNLAEVDVEVFEDIGGDAGAFFDQAQENVLRADVLVVEALGLLVGQLHHFAGAIRETFIHSSRLRQSASPPSKGPAGVASGRAKGVIPVRSFCSSHSAHPPPGRPDRSPTIGGAARRYSRAFPGRRRNVPREIGVRRGDGGVAGPATLCDCSVRRAANQGG